MQSIEEELEFDISDTTSPAEMSTLPTASNEKENTQPNEKTPVDGPKDATSVEDAVVEVSQVTGTSSVSDETVINDDSEDCPIIFFPSVPQLKYYERPLHMTRQPMMSQINYEEWVLARGEAANYVDDHELIGIECPDKHDGPEGTSHLFEVERQVLSRSPFFHEYFNSDDFLQGCETVFTFLEDPAVCFLAIKTYLEEGTDRFSARSLEYFVTTRETTQLANVDTMELLVRTRKMASKLRLHHLADMVTTVMHALQWKMDACCCVTLASLIFGQGHFDKSIENFILKHVGKNFQELNDMKTWHDLLETHKDGKLGKEWAEMDSLNKRVLTMILEGSDSDVQTIQRRLSALSTINVSYEGSSMELTREAVQAALIAAELVDKEDDSDDDRRKPEDTAPFKRSASIDKARATLGLPPIEVEDSYSDSELLEGRRYGIETKKARQVLGMYSSGGGRIAGRRHKASLAVRARQVAQGGFGKRIR